MNIVDTGIDRLAVARRLLLEPSGLHEGDLARALAEVFEHRVDLPHRGTHALHHAHRLQLLEFFEGVEKRRGGEAGAERGLRELEHHAHVGQFGVGRAVLVCEAVPHLEAAPFVDRDPLPVAAAAVAFRAGHAVVGEAAGVAVVTEKRGGVGRWPPEALDLAGIEVGVPEPAHGDSEVGDHLEGERVGVGGN